LEKRDLLRKGMKCEELERVFHGSKLEIAVLGGGVTGYDGPGNTVLW
jgi:hypothetical protein